MKRALNAWTVEGSLDMEQTFAAVAKAGFEGIELNVDAPGAAHGLSMNTTAADYAAIRELSKKYNLPVCSISTSLWGGKMGNKDQWKDGEALLYKQIEAATELGADGILTVPGGMGGALTLDGARRNSIAFMQAQKNEIEKLGIFVGLENVWNGFFTSPLDMASFIDEINISNVGAYYDVGNVIAFSWSERWIEVLGERIHNVHIKDFKRTNDRINCGGTWEDLMEGSTNWEAVIPALRAAGFDGYLTAEVFSNEPGPAYYKKVADAITVLIEKY